MSVVEGGIFANVSTPGEKLLLLYIVLDKKNKTSFGKKKFWGKFRRWEKVKTHKLTLKKLRLHMNTNILSFNKCKFDTM